MARRPIREMGCQGPLTTRIWTHIEREVLGEDARRDRGIVGRRTDLDPHDYGASVRMMDLEPALWEDDFENQTDGLWDYVG